MNLSGELKTWLRKRQDLDRYATSVLGPRGWALIESYGRLMAGPRSGSYVSSLDASVATELVEALERGEELAVHLMHRHRSGNCESSALRVVNGHLVMRYPDREERA